MPADLVSLADAIVSQLQTDLADDAIVSREWQLTLDLGAFVGKKVLIFPNGYTDGGPVTRSEKYWDLRYTIVITERYTGEKDSDGEIPDSWIDGQVEWVEREIYNRLSDEKNPYIVAEQYWAQTADVITAVDFVYLTQQNLFWSEVEITFRKLK